MKRGILLAIIALSFAAITKAQEAPYMKGDTLITTIGMKIYPGLVLKIGRPADDRRNFTYLDIGASKLTTAQTGKAWAGHETKVKKIKEEKSGSNGTKYTVVSKASIMSCYIDIENALASGEIVTPKEFQVKPSASSNPSSIADEIKKLKELFDSGAISKEEYEKMKSKLIN